MRKYFVFFFVLLSLLSKGQDKEKLLDIYKKNGEFTFGLNNRRTHIHNQFGVIYGFKVGLNFDRRLKNTFGINSTLFPIGAPLIENEAYTTAKLHFVNIAEEYIFYKKQRLSFSTYASVGYGLNFYEIWPENSNQAIFGRNRVVPFEFGMQFYYIILKWIELNVGAGWRLFLVGNESGLPGYFFKVGAGIKYKAFKTAFFKKS